MDFNHHSTGIAHFPPTHTDMSRGMDVSVNGHHSHHQTDVGMSGTWNPSPNVSVGVDANTTLGHHNSANVGVGMEWKF